MNDIIISIVASVIGALLMLLIQYLYRRFKEIRNPFTGYWEDEILFNDQMIKQDIMEFRQIGEEIRGKISRKLPSEQNYRSWNMIGRKRGKDFFAIFWAINDGILSYGCWFLHQTGDFQFKGNYMKLIEGNSNQIEMIPMTLKKIKMKKKEFKKEYNNTALNNG